MKLNTMEYANRKTTPTYLDRKKALICPDIPPSQTNKQKKRVDRSLPEPIRTATRGGAWVTRATNENGRGQFSSSTALTRRRSIIFFTKPSQTPPVEASRKDHAPPQSGALRAYGVSDASSAADLHCGGGSFIDL